MDATPGCDILCWLPGDEPSDTYSIGVVAHISAASKGGPRYNPNLSSEERRESKNAIYLCQNHAHEIDVNSEKYSIDLLIGWKEKHEVQIKGQASGKWLLPNIDIKKLDGVSITRDTDQIITGSSMGNKIEHKFIIENTTDFEFRRIGFRVQYPELIKNPPIINHPPGFEYKITGENMNWHANVRGEGSKIEFSKVEEYRGFQFEGTSILQNQKLEFIFRSTPDENFMFSNKNKYYHWISGFLGTYQLMLDQY